MTTSHGIRSATGHRRPPRRRGDFRLDPDGGFYFTACALEKLRHLGGEELTLTLRADYGDQERVFKRVTVIGEEMLVDVATGSLYRAADGMSLSGSRLRVLNPPQPKVEEVIALMPGTGDNPYLT